MNARDLTQILLNILLVLVIIFVYVNLNKKMDKIKEGYPRGAAWSMAKKMSGKYNPLVADNKQFLHNNPVEPMLTNSRGDFAAEYISGRPTLSQRKLEISPIVPFSTINIDTSKTIPDTSDLPAEVQSGVVESALNVTNTRAVPASVMELDLENNGDAKRVGVDAEGFRTRLNAR